MNLRLDSVRVRYGSQTAIRVESLDLLAGELVAVVGPNGAGKSTLIRAAAGVVGAHDGSVTWGGVPIASLSPAELALVRAYLPHGQSLDVPFTAREVVAMGRFARQRASVSDRDSDDVAIREAMAAFDVVDLAHRRLDQVSGGEQARVALARLIAQETPVVLLDEPTAALDLGHQESATARLRDLARAGRVVAAVFHDLNLAAAYADRVLVIASGEILADGAPGDVLTDELLTAVYRHPLAVVDHPFRSGPLVVPLDRDIAP